MAGNRRVKNRRVRHNTKAATGKIYVAIIMLFMVVVMTFQIVSLYKKNQQYKKREDALNSQVEAAEKKNKELQDYDKYVGSEKYIEDEASEKLGLTYDDWIIFREQ